MERRKSARSNTESARQPIYTFTRGITGVILESAATQLCWLSPYFYNPHTAHADV